MKITIISMESYLMEESLYYASQEIKRAEHLLYVSLKYTRTGDVIKSLIARLIACFDYIMEGILDKKEEKNEIPSVPTTPFEKVSLLKEIYKNNLEMMEYLDFYLILRKIHRSNGEGKHEFRRNLTLNTTIDDTKIEITIDIIGDYYHKTLAFLHFVRDMNLLDKN
jgi:hypothetical protein